MVTGVLGSFCTVALRKESVDRNTTSPLPKKDAMPSLSARRAWIEMSPLMWPWSPLNVALRKESVDRNYFPAPDLVRNAVALRKESVDRNWQDIDNRETISASLSARRAWIEIFCPSPQVKPVRVALRKESVDRNSIRLASLRVYIGRSPQGERG